MNLDKPKIYAKLNAFFANNPPTFGRTYDVKTLTVDRKRYYYDQYNSLMEVLPTTLMTSDEMLPLLQYNQVDRLEFLMTYIEETFRGELLERKKNEKQLREAISSDKNFEILEAEYFLKKLQPARVLGDTRPYAGFKFFDKDTREITDYDYFAVQNALKQVLEKRQDIDTFFSKCVHLTEVFDPHGNYGVNLINEETKVYQLNTYRPPEWKVSSEYTPEIDPDLEKLFNHLFPGERCREFVYTWIYHSLTARAGTYLYCCGEQGTGKNTLATLLAQMHGEHNTTVTTQDSPGNRFNSFLANKTFIFLDEHRCRTKADKDILKSIVNDRIQLEGKYKEHEDVEIYSSYLIANNSWDAITLDPIDRRFSVPMITDTPITTVYPRKWIADLTHRIKTDAKMVGNFALWVQKRYDGATLEWAPEEPYQTKRFEQIVVATARLGMLGTLEKIQEKAQDSYDYYVEKSLFRNTHKNTHFPSLTDWQRFFRDLRIDGKPVCTVEKHKLIPTEEYLLD